MIEAYKIAVRISLVENVTRGLSALGTHFTRVNIQAEELNTRLKNIAKSVLLGGGLLTVGGAGLRLLQGPLEEAKKYETELTRIKALGFGDHVVKTADKTAKGLKIAGSSALENAKTIREALSIMGNIDHAKAALPTLTKMRIGIETVMGGAHGGKFDALLQAAIKTAELRGALVNRKTGQIDSQHLIDTLNKMTQAYVASGGLVKPTDYLQAIKTGGVSTKLMNDEMFLYGLGHYMQESGGSRIGTASMSMFQNWAMGRMSQQVAENMKQNGLLDARHIHYGKTGHITKVDPMGMIHAKKFVENPFRWVNEVLVPKLKAQGIQGDDLNLKVAQLLGIRTAQNLADQMIREQKVTERYIERAKKAANIDRLYAAGQHTLAGKERNYEAAIANLKLALGKNILPLVVIGLEKLNTVLSWVAEAAKKHPLLTQFAAGMFAITSAALVLGGSMLLFRAAFGGLALLSPRSMLGFMVGSFKWVLGALVGIARGFLTVGRVLGPVGLTLTAIAAAAWLIYRYWEGIGPYVRKVWAYIKNVFHTCLGGIAGKITQSWAVIKAACKVSVEWIASKIRWMWGVIKPYIDLAANRWRAASKGVSDFTQRLYESITGWIGKLWRWLKQSPAGAFIGSVADHTKAAVKRVYDWENTLYPRTLAWARAVNHRPDDFGGGGTVADSSHPNKGRGAPAPVSAWLPLPRQTQTIQIDNKIALPDGRVLAQVVTTHQAREMNRPSRATPTFDPTMGALPVGMP